MNQMTGTYYDNQAFITATGNRAALLIHLLTQLHKEDQAALNLLNAQLASLRDLHAKQIDGYVSATILKK